MKIVLGILRWIAVLPASFLAALVLSRLGLLVVNFVLRMPNGDHVVTTVDAHGRETNPIQEFVMLAILYIAIGTAFVVVGGLTAPAYRRVVSGFLASLMTVLLLLSLAVLWKASDWRLIVSVAECIVGGVIGFTVMCAPQTAANRIE